jgi:adenylate cyclase
MNTKLLEKALKLYAGEKVLKRLRELGEQALKPSYQEQLLTIYGQDLKSLKINGEIISRDELMHFKYDYLNQLTHNIINHNGYIDHYELDFILAFWETNSKSHAIDACKCALDVIDIAGDLSTKWQQKGISKIDPKIGIVTGSVLVGNFGSDHRLQYSLVGEVVNYLYRLVGANEFFQTNILIAQSTKEYLGHEIPVTRVDEIMIKGKNDPQTIYTITKDNP